jgi:DnaJ-class molecular chaperone
MKTTQTYFSGCKWCNATGLVPTTTAAGGMSTSPYEVCPVCHGTKTVVVTETIEQ